jgi:hypothetical protein
MARLGTRVGKKGASAVWIMGTGSWNDNGVWFDQSVWVDSDESTSTAVATIANGEEGSSARAKINALLATTGQSIDNGASALSIRTLFNDTFAAETGHTIENGDSGTVVRSKINAALESFTIGDPILTATESTEDGEVFEDLNIDVASGVGLTIRHANCIVRRCRIQHRTTVGILAVGATNLLIEDCEVINANPPASGVETVDGKNNIECDGITGLVIQRVTLRSGSSGIYLFDCPSAQLQGIEGYDFRGPSPRGQLVQFNQSPSSLLEDFYCLNGATSWPEDVVSVYDSDGTTVRRGVVDGCNSPSGVGVMLEVSANCVVEDVDAFRMGNGCFSAYSGANNAVFRRCRAAYQIGRDQGRGKPTSRGWDAGERRNIAPATIVASASTASFLDGSNYEVPGQAGYTGVLTETGEAWENNISGGTSFDPYEMTQETFATQALWLNRFVWTVVLSTGHGAVATARIENGNMALWTPADLAVAPHAWYDAQQYSGGASVSQWDDLSGNARHAVQATGADQPTYGATLWDGSLPAIRFGSGGSKGLVGASMESLGYSAAALFSVEKNSVDPPAGAAAQTSALVNHYGGALGSDHTPYQDGITYHGFGSTVRKTVGDLTTSWAAARLLGIVSESGAWSLDLDATQEFTTGTNTVGFASHSTSLGRSSSNTTLYYDGWGAEIVLLGYAPTTDEKERLEGYLAWRWGIEANLPSGHAYELAAPTTGGGLFFRPTSTTSAGTWLTDTGGSNLHTVIDETSAGDSDYIKSSTSPNLDVCKIAFTKTGGVDTAEDVVVRYRYRKQGGETIDLRVRLLEGTTERALWTHSAITTSFVTAAQTLTAPEKASVTDWDNVFLEFRADVP